MKFCENCGSKIEDGASFCENCGAEIPQEEVVTFSSKKSNDEVLFCEECGSKLEPGAEFCENCGAKVERTVSRKSSSSNMKFDSNSVACSLFQKGDWSQLWAKAGEDALKNGVDLGIIITDVSKAASSSYNSSENEVKQSISDYINFARNRNKVQYYLYDVGNSKVGNKLSFEENIYKLQSIINIARPKFLFIIGNYYCISNVVWENQSGDSDPEVFSDLPYVTLDLQSPWEGQKYHFENSIRVGRLPTMNNVNFQSLINNYMNNTKNDIDEIREFGVTAAQWEDTSRHVYGNISNKKCLNSPDVVVDNISDYISGNNNLLYFNVHGSDAAPEWYGQSGGSFPPVFSPNIVEGLGSPFVIGVEACYGGQNNSSESSHESTVLNAFKNKCVSMLASSVIAYGTPCGPGTCADVVIGTYMKDIKSGYCAGDSYINALKALTSKDNMNDAEIKTLAEFSLYGDPAFGLSTKNRKKSFSITKAFGGVQKGLKVPVPDIRRAVKSKLVNVESKLANPIKDHVSKTYGGFEDTYTKFFQMSNSNLLQGCFTKSSSIGETIVKIYFDDNGKIVQELVSK